MSDPAFWDMEAERQVLSACLRRREAVGDAIELGLRATHFSEANGHIFSAIQEVAESDMPLSPVTVARQLGDRLADAGGQTALGEIWREGGVADAVGYYGAIVLERAAVRREYQLVHNYLLTLSQPGVDASREMARFRDALMEADAEQVRNDGPRSIREVLEGGALERLERWMESPHQARGIPTGHPVLDRLLGGLKTKRMSIIGAATSAGKTQWMEYMARFAAIGGYPSLLLSTEMSADDNADRWVFMEAGRDRLNAEQHGLTEAEKQRLRHAAWDIAERPIYVWEMGGLDLARIRVAVRRMRARYGIRLVLLDMLNGVRVDISKGENMAQALGRVLADLHALAVSEDIHLMATAHVNRAAMQRNDVLGLNDFRDSAAVEQWADQAITFQPVDATGQVISRAQAASDTSQRGYVRVLANVCKNRFGALGQCVMHLDWDAGGRFTTPQEASA
jgi:replicative DNA helicase